MLQNHYLILTSTTKAHESKTTQCFALFLSNQIHRSLHRSIAFVRKNNFVSNFSDIFDVSPEITFVSKLAFFFSQYSFFFYKTAIRDILHHYGGKCIYIHLQPELTHTCITLYLKHSSTNGWGNTRCHYTSLDKNQNYES